jgi:hypothetical protein
MTQYMLSVFMTEDPASFPEDVVAQMNKDIDVVNDELQKAGAWVFAGGLEAADTATVVNGAGGNVTTTDGPFTETKEHVGGFWIIEAADLDAALAWAAKATVACRGAIEVRPFQSA